MSDLIPIERIESKILVIRGQNVLLAYDMAELLGVETKRLNEQVKRNIERFPEDFMSQLTEEEFEALRSQFATTKLSKARTRPYVFTEHGAVMAANVVNSRRAIQASVIIARAFIQMRRELQSREKTNARLDDIEDRLGTQEMQTLVLIDKMGAMNKKLKAISSKDDNKLKIGFKH